MCLSSVSKVWFLCSPDRCSYLQASTGIAMKSKSEATDLALNYLHHCCSYSIHPQAFKHFFVDLISCKYSIAALTTPMAHFTVKFSLLFLFSTYVIYVYPFGWWSRCCSPLVLQSYHPASQLLSRKSCQTCQMSGTNLHLQAQVARDYLKHANTRFSF